MWWLADNATMVLIVLGIVLVALLFLWWQRQTRNLLIAVGGVAAAMVVVLLLSLFVETDRKKLAKIMDQMVEGLNARRFGDVMKHVADKVRTESVPNSPVVEKGVLEAGAKGVFTREPNLKLVYWKLQIEKLERPKALLTCFFKRDTDDLFAQAEMEFTLDNEAWKLTAFSVYQGLHSGQRNILILPIGR